MEKNLVIVESPAKAKTISKYLGPDFIVKASVGHIKDLPKNKMGVDIEKDFAPSYEVIRGKTKVIKEIQAASKKAENIYLAPDPDREGEAIACHIKEIINDVRNSNHIYRVIFNEITPKAIRQAIENPTELNQHKYESQQARRILDRLVGYQISPILWKKVRRGLSAGRVQSVAVRIIVDRENEIRAFIPVEYWNIEAHLKAALPPSFIAKLAKYRDKKIEVHDETTAREIERAVKNGTFLITDVQKKQRSKRPYPPFTTSKLQQDAANKLRFTAKKTMMLAQQLYEGVELGAEGLVALVTYIRTDSVRVSDDALSSVRSYIHSQYGTDYLPEHPNFYKNSKKSVQDAHEAIRPTYLDRSPASVKPFLSADQYKLYNLIWQRFVASQMTPALFDQTTVEITVNDYLFKTVGSIQKFDGYKRVYEESVTSSQNDTDNNLDENALLPPLQKGDILSLTKLDTTQHFTQPPPRFTESSLVKELEERGIGRPSTYAQILSTIQEKKYVKKEENKFSPTELGELVTDLLVKNFKDILDIQFTAQMEEQLDKVEEGETDWIKVLHQFYTPFQNDLANAKTTMRDVKREEIPTDIICDQCGAQMVRKWGKNGSFLACSTYPKCRNTKEYRLTDDGKIVIQKEELSEETCPKCQSHLAIKKGKFGRFLACSTYPKCEFAKPYTIGVPCPKDNCKGSLAEKTSRRGKVFYSCNQFPKCNFSSWDLPVAEPCPSCDYPLLTKKITKQGAFLKCIQKTCGYSKSIESA